MIDNYLLISVTTGPVATTVKMNANNNKTANKQKMCKTVTKTGLRPIEKM